MPTKPTHPPVSLIEPWPNTAMARLFLRGLVQLDDDTPALINIEEIDTQQLVQWARLQGLEAIFFQKYNECCPELTQLLQADVFEAIAEDGIRNSYLDAIVEQFTSHEVVAVLLKGASLAKSVYQHSWLRIMSDADIWVWGEKMEVACQLMEKLGFFNLENEARPRQLQALAGGEVQFYHSDWSVGLIELHWSPFAGWWLKRVAKVDDTAVWSRIIPLPDGYYTLAHEDMAIQVAVHLAINHQFGLYGLRNLLDLALLAQRYRIDWLVVAQRAKEWRVATAVYVTLALLHNIFDINEVQPALKLLQPSAWRWRLIQRFVSPESIIGGHDLRSGHQRYLLLLLLVDRMPSALKLVFRTLWPEREWLQSRYADKPVSRRRHMWQVIRYGEI